MNRLRLGNGTSLNKKKEARKSIHENEAEKKAARESIGIVKKMIRNRLEDDAKLQREECGRCPAECERAKWRDLLK